MSERNVSHPPRSRRVLVFVYGLFAVAATARALVQLATDASKARWRMPSRSSRASSTSSPPGPWRRTRRKVAMVTITVELTGVLVIGTLSHPADLDRGQRLVRLRERLRLRAARPAGGRALVAVAARPPGPLRLVRHLTRLGT